MILVFAGRVLDDRTNAWTCWTIKNWINDDWNGGYMFLIGSSLVGHDGVWDFAIIISIRVENYNLVR